MNDPNPYEPVRERGNVSSRDEPRSLLRAMIGGALWSLGSAFPITILMALFFRFPVPFRGIDSGPSHVIPAIFGLLFYGVLFGGFILLLVCGALSGAAAFLLAPAARDQRRLQRCLAIGITFVLLFVLATLDWYIGPW